MLRYLHQLREAGRGSHRQPPASSSARQNDLICAASAVKTDPAICIPIGGYRSADIRPEPIGAYVTSGNQLPNGCDQWVGLLRATHTIGVAQCALRRSLRSSHPAELAGRSCPHRWARSGLPYPGGLRRVNPAPLSLDCHFYSNEYAKNGGAKGIRTPGLLHAIQGRAVAERARRRKACRSPAVILARRGLTLPGACRHWLPTWLPGTR